MAKNKKTRDTIGLIEFLNKATSLEPKSSSEIKKEIDSIKKAARDNGWGKDFSKLLHTNPNWVDLAKSGVRYVISKNGKTKGAFPRIMNGQAIIKVVM